MCVSQLANAAGFMYENIAPTHPKNETPYGRATETSSSDLQ
jgi:hypothetical protein